MVHWYHKKMRVSDGLPPKLSRSKWSASRPGVRMERRILKVLKALAEYKNMTLGDLLEGIVLHAFDGKAPFTAETLRKISELKGIYELDLDARSSHRLKDRK